MEEMDFQAILDRFHEGHFTRGEQVILANFGTNQTLLSLIYQKPCRLKLLVQKYTDGLLKREVMLYYGEVLGCLANTIIPVHRNRKDVMEDIISGASGLGQIVVKYNLPCRRALLKVSRKPLGFERTYAIDGPEVYLEITEYFPRAPLLNVGWEVEYEAK